MGFLNSKKVVQIKQCVHAPPYRQLARGQESIKDWTITITDGLLTDFIVTRLDQCPERQ